MRLKDLREDRDETQREIPLAALCKLADHYDVTLDYLVGRSDAPGK